MRLLKHGKSALLLNSKIYENDGKIDNGLHFLLMSLSPDLKSGITLAIFILSGTMAFVRDKFIISLKGLEISVITFSSSEP